MAVPLTATSTVDVATQAVEACLPWCNEPVHFTGPLEMVESMCVGPEFTEGCRQVQLRLKAPTANGDLAVETSCVVYKSWPNEVYRVDEIAIYCGPKEPTRPFGQQCSVTGTREKPLLESNRERDVRICQ